MFWTNCSSRFTIQRVENEATQENTQRDFPSHTEQFASISEMQTSNSVRKVKLYREDIGLPSFVLT